MLHGPGGGFSKRAPWPPEAGDYYYWPDPFFNNYLGKNWKGRKPGPYKWYEIQDTIEYYKEFSKDKIIYPNICKKPEFTFDKEGLYTNQKCFIIPGNHKYLLGILNSKVSFFLFKNILPKLRGGFFEPGYEYLNNFPIPRLELTNPVEKSQYDRMAEMVDHMLELHEHNQSDEYEEEKSKLEEKIKCVDGEIDQLVYELYELTPEEIKIVEEKR